MVSDAFEFESNRADGLGTSRDRTACQRFDRLGIGGGMSDGRIPCQGFHVMNRAFIWPADHGPLHAPMLVAQRYFQMQNLFPVALKSEMAGFNDARMHRPHRDFMDLFSGDLEEVHRPL